MGGNVNLFYSSLAGQSQVRVDLRGLAPAKWDLLYAH